MPKKKDKKKEKKRWKKLLKKVSTPKLVERRSPDRMSDAHVKEIKTTIKKLSRIFSALMALTVILVFNFALDINVETFCVAILAVLSTLTLAKFVDNLEAKIDFKRK